MNEQEPRHEQEGVTHPVAPVHVPALRPPEPPRPWDDGFEDVADGRFRSLDPRFVTVERIGSFIFDGFIFAGLVVFLIMELVSGWFPWWAQIPIGLGAVTMMVLLIWLAVKLPRWSYEATRYAITPLGIEIRRGIWWKAVIDVPRSRIQHTDVSQGPLARRFGIGKLTIYTAGTTYASVELDGLPHGRALRIRDFLIRGGEQDGV